MIVKVELTTTKDEALIKFLPKSAKKAQMILNKLKDKPVKVEV